MENNMYIEYNSNPENKLVGDCVVRAISKVTNQDWEKTYMEVCVQGFMMHDMPSSNSVWGGYLFTKGFRRYIIPDTYPKRYTVKQFCTLKMVIIMIHGIQVMISHFIIGERKLANNGNSFK